jgi:cystathionine beta-lyase family protein involved in aluminum resistance
MEWTSNKLADALKNWSGNREQLWAAANILQDQAQEIDSLKKQINQLSVYRKPRIGDRVILLDDESEGVIERVSIANGPRISFDDGCYGNYTLVELITLFAYKESE